MLVQRLFCFQPENDEKNKRWVENFIAMTKNNKGYCDEIWFPTSYGYPTLDRHEQIANYEASLAKYFTNAGIRVSMQLSNTIGHGEHMKKRDCSGIEKHNLREDLMVDATGAYSQYCFCWRGKNFIDYNKQVCKIYAKTVKPYRIWIDDDLRATNHAPVNYGCFCEKCISKFNKQYGYSFDRPALVKEINRGDVKVRKRWTDFLCEGLYCFSNELAKSMYEGYKDVKIGLQNGPNGLYLGFGYACLFKGLSDAAPSSKQKQISFRPGAGAYNDDNPVEFLIKAECLEFQCETAPKNIVKEICPEIESVPQVAYGKSIGGLAFESDVYFAYGADMMSYVQFGHYNHEPFDYRAREAKRLASHRKYWDKLAKINKQTTSSGLQFYVSPKSYLRKLDDNEKDFAYTRAPFTGGRYYSGGLSSRLGIPVCFGEHDENPVYMLTCEDAKALSKKELSFLRSKNVITDGDTAEYIYSLGFDIGCKPNKIETIYLATRSLGVIGDKKNFVFNQSYDHYEGYAFTQPTNALPISVYEKAKQLDPVFDGEYPFGIEAYITTNAEGGKWAIFGSYPFDQTESFDRRNQILCAINEISQGKSILSYVSTPVKAVVRPRVKSGKVKAVSIINTTPGVSDDCTLVIKNPQTESFFFMNADGKKSLTYTTRKDKFGNVEYVIDLPSFNGWQVGTVFCK